MNKTKFNLLFEQIMSDLKKEGGQAAISLLQGSEDLDKLSKIKRENIQPTLNFIKQNILIPLNISDDLWTAEVGSVGKKAESGDMDIAINMEALRQQWNFNSTKDVRDYICEKLIEFGFKATININMINFVCPIQGSQLGQLIQVDFFNSVDLEYTKLEKFSPSEEESLYKGLHRTELWRAIMKSCSIAAAENATDIGEFTALDGRVYPAKQFQHLIMMDDGFWIASKNWLKKNGELRKAPEKDILPRKFLGRDFQVILDMLFGKDKYHISDLQSFETIWNNILMDPSFPYPNRKDDIITTFYYECIKKHVVIPTELQEYIDKHGLLY